MIRRKTGINSRKIQVLKSFYLVLIPEKQIFKSSSPQKFPLDSSDSINNRKVSDRTVSQVGENRPQTLVLISP